MKKLSTSTIKHFRCIIKQILNHAVNLKILAYNAANQTTAPKLGHDPEKDAKKALSEDSRVKIIEAAFTDEIFCPIVTAMIFTGIRSAELIALTWDDVDFSKDTIHIKRAVSVEYRYTQDANLLGRDTIIKDPKTKWGYRTIKLPSFVMDILLTWKTHIDEMLPNHSNYVFCSTKTGELRTYQGLRTSFRHFLERNNLQGAGITLHKLRHTCATILAEKQVNAKLIQKLLGHSDVRTTLSLYSHVVRDICDHATDIFDGVYNDLCGSIEFHDESTANVQQLDG